jgi:hypothetical protein
MLDDYNIIHYRLVIDTVFQFHIGNSVKRSIADYNIKMTVMIGPKSLCCNDFDALLIHYRMANHGNEILGTVSSFYLLITAHSCCAPLHATLISNDALLGKISFLFRNLIKVLTWRAIRNPMQLFNTNLTIIPNGFGHQTCHICRGPRIEANVFQV